MISWRRERAKNRVLLRGVNDLPQLDRADIELKRFPRDFEKSVGWISKRDREFSVACDVGAQRFRLQQLRDGSRTILCGIDQRDRSAGEPADGIPQQRIVRATEDEGVDAFVDQ